MHVASQSEAPSGYERVPYILVFEEKAAFKDTYGGEVGRVTLKAHLLRPRGRPSKTVIIFMHPIGGGEYLPMPVALAKAGFHVIYCNSRYPGVDYALIMEKVAIDLGACVRDARERWGYDKVVLAGWSGGGSLSAFYQAEAESPTVRCTPAGDPPDLTSAGLVPADGLMFLAAHVSRARTLTEWMDASITDESRPDERDPELDLYNPANPNQPPYDQAFIARYRVAQIARNQRITAWVKTRLGELRTRGRPDDEYPFVVRGTMADPRFLDPAIDPNDRRPRWCYLGDPQVVNDGPVGLARFSTLRSWLSQWSLETSHADGEACTARIQAPVLVVSNSADDACTPSHAQRLFDAVSHGRKELAVIRGASHYYIGQPRQVEEATRVIARWLEANHLS
ncbi:MAG: alpha/beta fold hydrolase [Gammaproteobacteria bacterium]|nr:alpha/beta fold hydrolase [Gammaproteobacteria bacterium]